MVERKTPDEIERMARAGALLAYVQDVLRDAVRPGVTTAELDELAESEIRAGGGEPSFLGLYGHPATLCVAVNEEIVHGVPSPRVRLREGDIVTIDNGVLLDGFHSDSACTWIVGGPSTVDEPVRTLVEATYEALWRGIGQLVVGNRLGDVSAEIEATAEPHGFGVIAEHNGNVIGGHGIGRQLHEDPLILGRGRAGRGMRIKPGLVFAIEPMFSLGSAAFYTRADGRTVATVDGSLAAHWEHTVAVTEDGPVVLTARPSEQTRLSSASAALG